jgi:cytoskeleton protein RodZ
MQPEKAPEQSVTQSIGQSFGQASEQASEQASDQASAAGQSASGEGERAAASDVSGLANTANLAGTAVESDPAVSIGEMPVTANTVVQSGETASETATETASNASDSAGQPVAGAQTTPAETTAETPAVAMVDATMAQPDVQDASPLPLPAREGSDVDTAPAMPSIQAAIAPPPPAAPVAPARPLSESSGEEARDNGAGGASSAATSDNLGYRPQIYGASNRNVRVVLRARAESWVQIQGANNELLLTRMLRPGDSYHAPDRTDLVLMTGNAGAIEIMVDGEALGTLGPMGQVRRNIKLNADQLRGEMRPTESERPEVR